MSLPELVRSLLGEESVTAEVSLGGEDALYVTPTRTLCYRADGLLSDESVDQYGHDAERISVSEGRRKSKVTLDYGLDGQERFSVPTKRLDDALEPIVAGVLGSNGIVDGDESVRRLFRFSELTVVVTDARVVKHIGAAVWDGEFEEFGFADVTDLDFEDGSVATSVVLTVGGRQERFKAPNEEARAVRETLKAAVLSYHDAPNLPALREAAEAAAESDAGTDPSGGSVDFGDGPDPLSAEPAAEAEAEAEAATATAAGPDADGRAGPQSAASTASESTAGGSEPVAADTVSGSEPERTTGEAEAGAGAGTRAEAGDGAGSAATVAETTAETASTTGTADSGRSQAVGSSEPRSTDTDRPQPTPESDGSAAATGSSGSTRSGTEEDAAATADAPGGSGDGDEFGDSGFQPAGPVDEADVAAKLDELTAAVEAQNEEVRRQRETFERLIEELRRGR